MYGSYLPLFRSSSLWIGLLNALICDLDLLQWLSFSIRSVAAMSAPTQPPVSLNNRDHGVQNANIGGGPQNNNNSAGGQYNVNNYSTGNKSGYDSKLMVELLIDRSGLQRE